MSLLAPPPPSAENPGRSADGSLRPWEAAFLFLLIVGLLTGFWIKCRKDFFTHDEFVTTFLVSNPNLGEMLATIRTGGEVNPPLYFIVQWCVARCFGISELSMRLPSALCIALAAVISFFTLRRAVGGKSAALAIALVFGLSRAVFWYMQWARYYGLFVLLAALMAWLFIRLSSPEPLTRRHYVGLFLIHAAMIYLHLFGVFFSGMFFVALLALDVLQHRCRWRVYGAIAAAWSTFLFWLPALKQQLQVTRDGTWTPRMRFGLFIDEPAMQTPLATILLLLALVTLASAIARQRYLSPAAHPPLPGLIPLLLLALAWMAVPVGAWLGSNFIKPFYLQRYVAPCVIALAFLLAVGTRALFQIARDAHLIKTRVPSWVDGLVLVGVLFFCVGFQPLRALQDTRVTAPFVDEDFGHPKLPMVFEDSMDYLTRAHYGRDREYVMLIDRDAAEADRDGYFTKLEERYFSKFRAHYADKLRVLYYNELPAWPDGFLVIDTDLAKTWDWLAQHHPDLKIQLLGQWPEGQKVYLVKGR